jgi:hypothetical protein
MKKASSTRRKKANVPAQKKLEQLELFPKTELKPLQGSKDKSFVAMRQNVSDTKDF